MMTSSHPILKAANGSQVWQDRYLNLSRAIRHWQWVCFGLSVIALILTGLTSVLALRHSIQPLVVETHQGMPIRFIPVSKQLPDLQILTQFAVTQFILNARTVLQDSHAQRTLLDKVYAYSSEEVIPFLRQYYETHNPLIEPHSTVQVNILNTLPLSSHTWQVTWEEHRDHSGESANQTTRWIATLTTREGAVTTDFMQDNPFGLYITHLSWSLLPSSFSPTEGNAS